MFDLIGSRRRNLSASDCNENIIKGTIKTVLVNCLYFSDCEVINKSDHLTKDPKCYPERITETGEHLKKGMEQGGKEI